MRLVVDSNILFSALIRDSSTRKIFLHFPMEFFIIPFNYNELEKYKKELIKKAKMNETSFNVLLDNILNKCIFIDDSLIFPYWEKAKSIMWSIDPKDTQFVAAALALDAYIWSDDIHFQKQNKVKILTTKELVKLL